MKIELASYSGRVEFSVKHLLEMLERRGVAVRGAGVWARFEELAGRVPVRERGESAEWEALEREVLGVDAGTGWGPWDLEEILTARPGTRVDRYDIQLTEEELRERMEGAWLGRVAGCMLGKPLEWFMKEWGSRPRVVKYLKEVGEYPLRGYVPMGAVLPYYKELEGKGIVKGPVEETAPGMPVVRERISYATADDDTDYSIMMLRKLQKLGRRWGPDESLDYLQGVMGKGSGACNASVVLRNRLLGLGFPEAARFANSSRECVRLQIRVDPLAYVCAGMPEEAAKLCWAEAAATGSDDGLYGAMWVGACIAAAFVEKDVWEVARRGLGQVPRECGLRRELERVMGQVEANGEDFDRTLDDIDGRWKGYAPNLAVPNCGIIAAGLLHGGGDFTRALGVCVAGGYDTDSNAASLGSMLGAKAGARGVPGEWKGPLNDRLETSERLGGRWVRISGLAGETVGVMRGA